MSFEKPNLYDLLTKGRSLVFVPTRSLALRLAGKITFGGDNEAFVITPLQPLADILEELSNRPVHKGVLITHPAAASHGFRVRVDRIVWVGNKGVPTRYDHDFALYQQAMARGDFWPDYTPAKWYYSEAEAALALGDL